MSQRLRRGRCCRDGHVAEFSGGSGGGGGADVEHNDNADGGDTSEGWGHPPYLEKDKKVFTTKASCVCPKFKIYFLEK
jgi:hypothetical protein